MCGIVGFLTYKKTNNLNEGYLDRACQSIYHRGPDEQGRVVLEQGTVGLGMRRLSIIDLASGSQPMFSEDGKTAIVFNGEIYNYIELKKQLPDVAFKTNSDTEVLLRLYERYGSKCFNMARGMFGVAIWDGHKKILVLARDRFGKKPLYYYYNPSCLIFGSEIKSILEYSAVPRKLNIRALDHYLSWLAVPEPDTMFAGIYKLPPGHILEIDATGNRTLTQYWQLSFSNTRLAANRKDAMDLLIEHLEDAIKIRLRSDVPLGILLSGGVDSSTIVALAARQLMTKPKTYSIGFDIQGFDEFQYSRMVAKRYDTEHTEEIMPAQSYWDVLQDMIWHLDEPMADTATVPLYYICAKAGQSVKVLLSGEGSDEMLAGYAARYINGINSLSGAANLSEQLPFRLKRKLWQKFGSGCWPSKNRFLWKLTQPLEYQFLKESVYGYYEGLREGLYNGGIYEGYQPDEHDLWHRMKNDGKSLLDKMLYTDANVNLPAYLLMKADKMSMAASVELRCPFLDHKFAEFCATLPETYKLDFTRSEGKILLKQAMEPHLPHEVLYRPKMGFPVPIDYWLRNHLKKVAEETLFESGSEISKFLNINHIRNMWQAHQQGRMVFGMQLWLLMLLELWMRRFKVAV